MDREAWRAAVHWEAESSTLKQLSMHTQETGEKNA